MMASTHSRTSEAAVFVTTAALITAHHTVTGLTWLPEPLKEWLVPPASLLLWLPTRTNPASLTAFTQTEQSGNVGGLLKTSLGSGQQIQDLGTIGLTFLTIWAIANFAGQLPDIDTPSSRSANSLEKVGEHLGSKHNVFLKLIFAILNIIPQSISWFANTFMDGHRGIVHSLPFTILISWAVGMLAKAVPFLGTPFYGTLFGVAFATHLFIDSFTKAGTRPFAPFINWKFHLLPGPFTLESSSGFWNIAMQVAAILVSLAAFGLGIIPALFFAA